MARSKFEIPIAFKSDPRGLKKAEAGLDKFKASLKGVAVAGAAAFAAVGVGASAFLVEAIKAADESAKIARSLEVAVKNSKAFGDNANIIKDVADALAENSARLGELSGIDDEVISGIKRNWLSIANISKTGVTGINKLAGVALDVAAGTGKAFEDVANAFTKAYGDPKGAVAKLQKAGIVLSQAEKDRYNTLIAEGKQTLALGYMTDTLAQKFKGQAEAFASPFDRLKVTWGNFMEDVGTAFLPVLDEILPEIQKGLRALALDPNFKNTLTAIANMLVENLPKGLKWLKDNLPTIAKSVKDIATAVTTITSTLFPATETQAQTQSRSNLIKKADKTMGGAPTGAYMTHNVVINASSVDTSANTGRAIANALSNYYRNGGSISQNRTSRR